MSIKIMPRHMLLALALITVLSPAAHAGVFRVFKKVFVRVITAPIAIVSEAEFDIARSIILDELYSSTR